MQKPKVLTLLVLCTTISLKITQDQCTDKSEKSITLSLSYEQYFEMVSFQLLRTQIIFKLQHKMRAVSL